MKTSVVNIRVSECDVYIGRAGKGQDGYFGNPFRLEAGEDRGATIERYKQWFIERIAGDDEFNRRILELKGKTLGCFCRPLACHGDVIAEYLNKRGFEEGDECFFCSQGTKHGGMCWSKKYAKCIRGTKCEL